MSEKISVLLSDVTIKGDIVEKEKLITDSKIDGDITSENIVTHQGVIQKPTDTNDVFSSTLSLQILIDKCSLLRVSCDGTFQQPRDLL